MGSVTGTTDNRGIGMSGVTAAVGELELPDRDAADEAARPVVNQSRGRRAPCQSAGVVIDDLLQQLASTRRFSLGVPRAVTVSRDDGRVLFLRTRGGEDPVSCLWGLDLGLRFSEVAGQRVGRLGLLGGTLQVQETVTRDRQGRPVLGPPKSRMSRRTVALPQELVEIIAEHLRRKGLTGSDSDALVFVSPDGGPRGMQTGAIACGCPRAGRQALRGSASTICVVRTRRARFLTAWT